MTRRLPATRKPLLSKLTMPRRTTITGTPCRNWVIWTTQSLAIKRPSRSGPATQRPITTLRPPFRGRVASKKPSRTTRRRTLSSPAIRAPGGNWSCSIRNPGTYRSSRDFWRSARSLPNTKSTCDSLLAAFSMPRRLTKRRSRITTEPTASSARRCPTMRGSTRSMSTT